ncbi:UDP-glucose dehydrogenase family protein [Brevibacillus daliensis]|uniref:UDP-glucose dehydrogenase family protein n=1 Tax=Brevibacillus daliensis TaxID=2892995 RepID=UPI001E53C39D|nr:UDP-glucose/GDP-mannose dehydrogenase family protein [Brevibacillus daliensis]
MIVGSGYVGLTTGAVLAYLGHEVTLLDIDTRKVDNLQRGTLPFYEPGLSEILQDVKLNYISTWHQFDQTTDIVMIAVGTLSKTDGDVDMAAVDAVAQSLGEQIHSQFNGIIVMKSTVPVGTAASVKGRVERGLDARGIKKEVEVASNPEFLREGQALFDSFYPERIVVGTTSKQAQAILHDLYLPILQQTMQVPTVLDRPSNDIYPVFINTTSVNAELIKYTANSFLAMKISFINEFANVAEKVGADIREVAYAIGLDKRIGPQFLQAGIGWGGSCFGKDMRAIQHLAKEYGCEMSMIQATIDVNNRQREIVIKKLQETLHILRGKTIGILGLSFKPNTDDIRESPSLDILRKLLDLGACIKVYDPLAMQVCQSRFPELTVEYCENVETLFNGCHAVVLVTDWQEFRGLDYPELTRKMVKPIFIDARNVLTNEQINEAKLMYVGMGRGGLKWVKEF